MTLSPSKIKVPVFSKTVKVSTKGQFVIPVEVRNCLQLRGGDKILVTLNSNNEVVVNHS
ncbi:AbrB/MazE/SpoVT family DNA-binding domain-containing protein [Lentilactobacillus kisonensis]|uniref:Transcriptional regulator, AbrB family n=2 Tax=Lentilactobacillus kisonensis TaxID=481722 RepID=H1LKD4_9LACO|nr:transcriptional regulator, AbrB family [Lentilactobacillus kisonensis F0435]KRL20531.1 hypothetical protein FC98_GL001394 [Lentilactobacillus kisonensis DSM 19906 = JCM 15041]